MRREVQPELLDDLPPADPRAIGSRADLRRLNALMGQARIFRRAFRFRGPSPRHLPPLQVVELGAGDGTLLLALAKRWASRGLRAEVTLVDRRDLLTPETRAAFAALGWPVQSVAADVFSWLQQSDEPVTMMLTNLFLHHFEPEELRKLLGLAAARTTRFIACEPRRGWLPLQATRLLGLIGCNDVTRHDAVVSVRAGFAGQELTSLWPNDPAWTLREYSAGLFSHAFNAVHGG